jgi:hypothetical protein
MYPRSIQERMGCNLPRFPRRARARIVMIRAMSSRFVHALFCLTRNTFRGEAACRAATSLDKKFAYFPTIICGNYGWMPNLLRMKATWVRQALCFACDALSCACSKGSSLRLLEAMFPFPFHLEHKHRGLVQMSAEWLLATKHSSSTAVGPLPHRMGLVFVIWGSESETIFGIGI